MLLTMDTETPALNEDGTLKDASEMEWVFSPSANTVELPPERVADDSGKRVLRPHHPSAKYKDAITAEQQGSDDESDKLSNSLSVPSKRKPQKSAQPRPKKKRPAGEAEAALPDESEFSHSHNQIRI